MTRWAALLIATCLLGSAGCGDAPGDRRGQAVTPTSEQPLRVVSLSPHMTQIVVDLGLAETLVGVAEHDGAAPADLPIVGNYVDVRIEAVLALKPTHVLTVAAKDSPSSQMKNLAANGAFALHAYPYPVTIHDIADTVCKASADEAAGIAVALGQQQAGLELRERFLRDLAAVRTKTAGLPPRRVLMAFGTNPLGASGPGSVNDAILGYAGGVNALAADAGSYVVLDREAIVAIDPDVILLLRPGDTPLVKDDPRLRSLRDLPIRAAKPGGVMLLNDPCVLLPATQLPRIAEAMADALHPPKPAALDPEHAAPDAR